MSSSTPHALLRGRSKTSGSNLNAFTVYQTPACMHAYKTAAKIRDRPPKTHAQHLHSHASFAASLDAAKTRRFFFRLFRGRRINIKLVFVR